MRGLNLTIGLINYLFFLKYTLNQIFLIMINLILEKKYFFILSSVLDNFLVDISNSFIKKSSFKLEDNILYLKSIEIIKLPNFNQKENIIYLLSPITVYSTINKKTYFYSPNENKFYELIKQNLLKKYKAYYKDYNVDNFDFDIELLKFDNKRDKKVIVYKNNCIISYEGMYKISGDKEILKFAWNTGLGSKNSQGFGMFEVKG
jgi:CRISPR-associated endoribonuclease Cas6